MSGLLGCFMRAVWRFLATSGLSRSERVRVCAPSHLVTALLRASASRPLNALLLGALGMFLCRLSASSSLFHSVLPLLAWCGGLFLIRVGDQLDALGGLVVSRT